MRIHFFPDRTNKGERVVAIPPCEGCKTLGALLISNGEQGTIVHFEHASEIAHIITELRKERDDGA